MSILAKNTRHKCFISYHHDDQEEVEQFIQEFDHDRDVLIARGIGASMSGDIINSDNDDYIMRRIREEYLRGTTVTIVLIGNETWGRKFVDWEIAASLRNTKLSPASGLLAIQLPSTERHSGAKLPARLSDNVSEQGGYAHYWKYPSTPADLARFIEIAYTDRTAKVNLRDNSRPLRRRNA